MLVARGGAFIKNGHFSWNSFPSALSWPPHSSSAFQQPPLHHPQSCDFASGQPSFPHRPLARTFFSLFGEGGPVLPALVWPRLHFSGREPFGPLNLPNSARPMTTSPTPALQFASDFLGFLTMKGWQVDSPANPYFYYRV